MGSYLPIEAYILSTCMPEAMTQSTSNCKNRHLTYKLTTGFVSKVTVVIIPRILDTKSSCMPQLAFWVNYSYPVSTARMKNN